MFSAIGTIPGAADSANHRVDSHWSNNTADSAKLPKDRRLPLCGWLLFLRGTATVVAGGALLTW